jgi:hypothetical protein
MIHRSKALLGALLTATALLGAGAYAQTGGSVWDSTQLPETKGIVKQYTLTPRGDVDGLILNDGTEVTLPLHLTSQIVFAVRPGDAVTIRGLKARALPLIEAASVTNFATGASRPDLGALGQEGDTGRPGLGPSSYIAPTTSFAISYPKKTAVAKQAAARKTSAAVTVCGMLRTKRRGMRDATSTLPVFHLAPAG